MKYKLLYIWFWLEAEVSRFPLRVTTRKRIDANLDSMWDRAFECGNVCGQSRAVGPDGFYDIIRQHYVTGTGQVLRPVHAHTNECDKFGCVVHNPTEHSLRDGRTHWRGDRGLMERIVGTAGHPDPDDIAYKRRTFGNDVAETELVHGCAGECEGAYERTN